MPNEFGFVIHSPVHSSSHQSRPITCSFVLFYVALTGVSKMKSVFHLMLLLFLVILTFSLLAKAQNCSTDALINNLGPSGDNLVVLSLVTNASWYGIQPAVTILDQNIVCLVTDIVRGQYTGASVVVSYNCTGGGCPTQ